MRVRAYFIHHPMKSPLLLPLLLTPIVALATPSGLNNIPTADTTPQGVFVLQAFTTLGEDRDADLNLGFKTGLELRVVRLEFGLSSHLYPDKGGPVTPHAKLAVPFGDGLPTVAVGIANLSLRDEDRRRAGDEFAYAVVSQDFGWFRVHGGCGLQEGEALPFFGFDKTFRMPEERGPADGKTTRVGGGAGAGSADPNAALVTRDLLTLRADAIAQRDQSWLYSAGVLVPVCKWFVMEAWGNFPDNGEDASLTLKANFVFRF